MKKQRFVWSFFIILFVMTLTGCKDDEATNIIKEETSVSTETKQEETTKSEEENTTKDQGETLQLDNLMLTALAETAISKMSLEEKIGQLFMVELYSLDSEIYEREDQSELTETLSENIRNYMIGGIIFYSKDMKNRKQTERYISNLQAASHIPLFIAADEEGGDVRRIGCNPDMQMTEIPNMKEIGETNDAQNAYQAGNTIAKEMKELGFNVNFAPVADLSSEDISVEIGNRSFGMEQKTVSKMVSEFVKGTQQENISATLKHFPGQGQANGNTHKGSADLTSTIKELRAKEFKPFEAGIKADADFVMVSHMSISAVEENAIPASLSKLVVTDILRNELSFDGIIITDSLNMRALTKEYRQKEIIEKALNAGNDILLMPGEIQTAYETVEDMIEEGKISEERIDESVMRILKTKIKRGIISQDSDLLSQE